MVTVSALATLLPLEASSPHWGKIALSLEKPQGSLPVVLLGRGRLSGLLARAQTLRPRMGLSLKGLPLLLGSKGRLHPLLQGGLIVPRTLGARAPRFKAQNPAFLPVDPMTGPSLDHGHVLWNVSLAGRRLPLLFGRLMPGHGLGLLLGQFVTGRPNIGPPPHCLDGTPWSILDQGTGPGHLVTGSSDMEIVLVATTGPVMQMIETMTGHTMTGQGRVYGTGHL